MEVCMLEIQLNANTESFPYGFSDVDTFLQHVKSINEDESNALAEEYLFGTQEAHDLFSNYLVFDSQDAKALSEFSHIVCDEILMIPTVFRMNTKLMNQEIDLLVQTLGVTKIEQRVVTLTAQQLHSSSVNVSNVFTLKCFSGYESELKRIYDYFNNHIMATKNYFYVYNKHTGVWEQWDDLEVKKVIFNNVFDEEITHKDLNAYFNILRISKYVSSFPTPPNHLLILENGAFDPVKKTLIGNNPYFYARNKIGFRYDPSALAPQWHQFLQDIFSHYENGKLVADVDQEAKIALLQEFFGLSLTPDTDFCKALILQGDGANGKSVILLILKMLVGMDNYTTISMKELKDKFKAVRLKDKLLNIDSDADEGFLIASESKFKMLVGGESHIVEEKYKAADMLKPVAKFWIAINKLPRVKITANSHGIYRRIEFLHFGRTFSEKEQNLLLSKTLATELPGIFNWALEGLERLYANGRFTIPQSSIDIKTLLEEQNDPIKVFYEERLELLPSHAPINSGIQAAKLLEYLKEFALSNGYDLGNLTSSQLSASLGRFNLKSNRSCGTKYFPVKLKDIASDE
jgi:putative DNA primase/helicase